MSSAAYAIWLQVRSAVTRAQYPAVLDYSIVVSGKDGAHTRRDRYGARCDPSTGSIKVFPISEEELAEPPPVPHGFNVYVQGWQIGRPEQNPDLIGEPILSPAYSFGMRYPTLQTDASASHAALPVIATVFSAQPEYEVQLLDITDIGGTKAYDLRMTPLRHPKDERLRELWVGTDDFLPRKAILSGNFTIAPLVDVPWEIDFSVVSGAPYIFSEHALKPLMVAHRRLVSHAVVAFDDIRESNGAIYHEPLLAPNLNGSSLVEP